MDANKPISTKEFFLSNMFNEKDSIFTFGAIYFSVMIIFLLAFFSSSKQDGESFLVIVFLLCLTVIVSILVLFLYNKAKKAHEKMLILQAVSRTSDLNDLYEGLLFVDSEKRWPIQSALKHAIVGFSWKDYCQCLKANAKEISGKLSCVPPSQDADEFMRRLTLVHKSQGWRFMTEEEKQKVENLRKEVAKMVPQS